ncbi:DUF6471 domain-containing protein [Caballeronia sp. NK8]|uniref:DUF6471 domain-containing protein n=1 Tax=Caballeronia sp. NK8 TaxID=140098 RepID=UPI001CEC0ECD|nr:DUF6471 domain-containing protein [Caballeronia sp. NK8]
MTAENQGAPHSAVDAVWAELASRTVRVILARQGVGYAQLAKSLASRGVAESARSVEGKIQRGTFRFVFLLQVVSATRAVCPANWASVSSCDSWEARATAVLDADLAEQRWIDVKELSRRLGTIGVAMSARVLRQQIRRGTFTAALYLQCATVCRFDGVFLFVDPEAMRRTAEAGMACLERF